MKMLKVTVTTFDHEADERGYLRTVNNYNIVEVTLEDTEKDRRSLLETVATALGVIPEPFIVEEGRKSILR